MKKLTLMFSGTFGSPQSFPAVKFLKILNEKIQNYARFPYIINPLKKKNCNQKHAIEILITSFNQT